MLPKSIDLGSRRIDLLICLGVGVTIFKLDTHDGELAHFVRKKVTFAGLLKSIRNAQAESAPGNLTLLVQFGGIRTPFCLLKGRICRLGSPQQCRRRERCCCCRSGQRFTRACIRRSQI